MTDRSETRTEPGPIAVVDYGVNNIGSVLNMLRRLDVVAKAARTPSELADASAIILPGIGAFDAGVTNLRSAGFVESIRSRVMDDHIPILGICLGMQLLTRGSEEGTLEGLALIPAFTRRLPVEQNSGLKVPHMGWNTTACRDRDLFGDLDAQAPRFYFVHSYHVVCDDPKDVAAECTYGVTFAAAIRRGHVFGTQFHPEKSHRFGMRVHASFVRTAHA